MKILITTPIYSNIESNPFVKVLSEGLQALGNDVVCSRDEFWNNPKAFDLIFFQWPQDLLTKEERVQQDPDTINFHLLRIEKQLQLIKKEHIPMFITVHNIHPHNGSEFMCAVYDLVYGYADAFHHMGDFSRVLFTKNYPQAHHFIVPHPIYYNLFDVTLSQGECRKKYGLPQNKPVIIAFGSFRNNDERSLILNLSHKYRYNCCLWAPKYNRILGGNNGKLSKAFTYVLYRMRGIKMYRGEISDEEMLEMITASDVVFIQRTEILNSGNLPLGFSLGKIVVGPDRGNVGVLLRETGNPIFYPDKKMSLFTAMDSAIEMLKNGNKQGQKNYEYAMKYWRPETVANKLDKEIRLFVNKTQI